MSTGTEIAKPDNGALARAVPDHLRLTSVDNTTDQLLSTYSSPLRIRMCQKMSKPPISEMFKEGDVFLSPTLDLIAKKGDSFIITPLFLFPEWISRNPQGVEPAIVDRSLDPKCVIAQKSRDPNRRKERWAGDPSGQKTVNHLEVLHFIVNLRETPTGFGQGMVAVMSFTSAELKTGQAFASAIKMRGVGQPGGPRMYGCQFEVKSGDSTNSKGTWSGLKITNPQHAEPWVMDTAVYAEFDRQHVAFKEDWMNRVIVVDMTDDDAGVSRDPAESTQY